MGICLIIKSGGGVDTSNATATADKILSGYTIYSNDNKVTGTMFNVANQCKTDPNIGSTDGSFTLWAGWNFGVWGGWHDGTAVLKVGSLASSTDCDIPNEWWCLWGYTYWAKGINYSGKMSVRGKKEWTIGVNGSQTIEDGWHDGNGTVKQSSSIYVDAGEWGPNPTTTNQLLCQAGVYYSANRWCWGASTLTKENIKKGVSIFGVTGTWQGWVDKTVWIIKDGELWSGFNITNITQYSDANIATGKTSFGTWTIGGYHWKDEGGSGTFDITGLDSLNISFVQIPNTTYYRTNAKFTMEFSYYWGYTSSQSGRLCFRVNSVDTIYGGYTVADYNTRYSSGDSISAAGGSSSSYDSPTIFSFYITTSSKGYSKSGSTIKTLTPIFGQFALRAQCAWHIRNFWVVRE